MKMFIWELESLQNWGYGELTILAENVTEAREKARELMREDPPSRLDTMIELEDHEEIAEWWTTFEADIAKAPKQNSVGFYREGSE